MDRRQIPDRNPQICQSNRTRKAIVIPQVDRLDTADKHIQSESITNCWCGSRQSGQRSHIRWYFQLAKSFSTCTAYPHLYHFCNMELKEPVDSKPASPATYDNGDEALKFLAREQQAGVVMDITETRALRWRIDLRIMPILITIYFLQYLDKTLLKYAAVMGIKESLLGNEYNNLGTIFYVGYLVAEPVTAYLMQRWPIGKYLGVNVACWGVLMACHAACRSYASLMVVRVLLGVFEASVAPSLVLITGMWWTKPEQSRRTGLWYMQIGVAQIVGAGISYGFQRVHSEKLANWQILFLFMVRLLRHGKIY
ncbi:hypothetical protein VTN77DRAFT_1857 [Rasamsonia byssochlamydoides]|uniref:uncharacterized protein n=1 Tax=Rasamsonia byssochlamydoides TaxID=89139 RepID=UPI0037433C6E